MPKNKIGGSGAKKAASKNESQTTRELSFAEELQDYAIVETLLGNGRVKLRCLTDNQERLGTIRGNMYKKVWIDKNDVVLVSLREYQLDKCDIILKFSPDEVKALKKYGEIKLNRLNNIENDDSMAYFVEDNNSDDVNIDNI